MVWKGVMFENSAIFKFFRFLLHQFRSETLALVPRVSYLVSLLPDDIWLDRVLAVLYSKHVSFYLTYHLSHHTSQVTSNIVRGLSYGDIKMFLFLSLLTLFFSYSSILIPAWTSVSFTVWSSFFINLYDKYIIRVIWVRWVRLSNWWNFTWLTFVNWLHQLLITSFNLRIWIWALIKDFNLSFRDLNLYHI